MPAGIGYGNKRGGRKRRPASGRQEEIMRVGRNARAKQGRGQGGSMERLPGGNLPKRGRMPGVGVPPKEMPGPGSGRPSVAPGRPQRGAGRGKGQGAERGKGRAGVGRQAIPGLGAQLTRRIQSGAISREQAQRTASERRTFAKAFGKDWREDVFGGTGKAREARTALAKDKDNPKLLALNKRLQGRRQKALESARAKMKGDGGTEAPAKGKGKGKKRRRRDDEEE